MLTALAAVGVAIYNNVQKRKEHAKALEEERQRQRELLKDYDNAYAKGEKDYLAYTNRMTEIEVEYNEKKLSHTDLTEQKRLSIQAEYYEAVRKRTEAADENMNVLQQWNDDVLDFLSSETGQAVAGTMETIASSMSAVFQQLTSIVQAELEIQTAAIEKRYEREGSMAEGNNYKVKRLEKAKEAEIAKVNRRLSD